MFSNDPAQHLEVLGKAVRSRQPPPREIDRGYRKLAGGILVPAKVIELPDPEDIDQVFRGVTHGLFFKLEGRLLPQAVPIESVFLQECHANPATERLFQLTPGCFTFGNEFAFKVLMKGDDRSNGFWLYLLFNAGVVASFTGEAAQLQFPPARYAFAPTHLST